MALSNNLKFCCGTLNVINGKQLKAIQPDNDGFYEVTVCALGTPTRKNVIYEPESLIEAMNNPKAPFNIMLQDGNLTGEYGHPVVEGQDDIPRLMRIDESKISHYFRSIWVDDRVTNVDGYDVNLMRAKIKPTGPYGETLKRQLEDPCFNNAFSIRSLCAPLPARNGVEYRKVLAVVTFDAVMAPGFTGASKRYAGTESLTIDTTEYDLVQAIEKSDGRESLLLSKEQIDEIFSQARNTLIIGKEEFVCDGGNLVSSKGKVYSLAALAFRGR